jgi:hypothetical protein
MSSLLSCSSLGDSGRRLGLPLRALLLVLGAFLISGCATGDYVFVTRISTGEKIHIPLSHGAPLPTKIGTIEIVYAGMMPRPPVDKKEFFYLFEVRETTGKAPRSIRIDDVSDDKPMLLLQENAPQLKNEVWVGKSPAFEPNDPALNWINYVDDSVRVFRFTVINSEGATVILDQGWFVPGWIKGGIRHFLGMEPPPPPPRKA